ncbi:MAG: DUF1559 domain-containing protein [Planctomycetota bacterium]
MRDQSHPAFSLVELLIVVTIVLLLMGICLTGLQATTLFVMDYSPGWLWSFGRASHVGFSTVLPPNAPRCSDTETRGYLTPQSLHPGGVFGLMADGAVRFITDHIDAGDPSLSDRQTGPSPYGVCGALGSRADAEVAALPLP